MQYVTLRFAHWNQNLALEPQVIKCDFPTNFSASHLFSVNTSSPPVSYHQRLV